MSVKGFCNIQNVNAIYNLLNGTLIEKRKKKEEAFKCSKFVLRTEGGIHLWARNRLNVSYKSLQLTKSYYKVKLQTRFSRNHVFQTGNVQLQSIRLILSFFPTQNRQFLWGHEPKTDINFPK